MNPADLNSTRLYPFADHDGYYFYAGTIDGGRQLLLFADGLALVFDADGDLLGHERREPPPRKPLPRDDSGEGGLKLDPGRNVIGQIVEFWETEEGRRDLDHMQREEERIRDVFFRPWFRELGFRPGTIRVRKFHDPETVVAIDDLPDFYDDFLRGTAHSCFSDEELAEFPEGIESWKERGMFILTYGNEIWMDGDGRIDST